MTVENLAQKLSKQELIQLVQSVYGIENTVDDIIDLYFAAKKSATRGSQALEKTLTKQLHELMYHDDFYGYQGCFDFSERLASVLSAINTTLRAQDPKAALTLTETFLGMTEEAFQRVDDSDGHLGDLFREAADQWLDIAKDVRAQTPDAESWPEKILHFFDHNDYGVLDDLIPHSAEVLREKELRQLAELFQAKARHALENPAQTDRYNHAAAHACIGLKSVAEALKDITLYEQGTLLISPEPNSIQLKDLIEYALAINELDRAAYWLEQLRKSGRHEYYQTLRYQWLRQTGDNEQLKRELLIDFTQRTQVSTLTELWALSSESEQSKIRKQVDNLSVDPKAPGRLINILLFMDDWQRAETVVMSQAGNLTSVPYPTLLNWIDAFAEQGHLLAQVVCYRALLDDLLDRKYSRAYHHGAKYFRKLRALDKRITDYQGLDNAQTYIRKLQAEHGRKRSFWSQAGYPNKPTKG